MQDWKPEGDFKLNLEFFLLLNTVLSKLDAFNDQVSRTTYLEVEFKSLVVLPFSQKLNIIRNLPDTPENILIRVGR
jgi:hypothetical protein